MGFDMDKWMATKRCGEVLVEHVGDFTPTYIDSVVPSLEQQMRDSIGREAIRKRVFHIFVECAQNLYHHVRPFAPVEARYGHGRLGALIVTKEHGDCCRISTGNFVSLDKAAQLQQQIDRINSLDEAQLKAYYRDAICTNSYSAAGGAGLGMIDMARKSGNKLTFQFFSVEGMPELLFFSLDVLIGKAQESIQPDVKQTLSTL